MLNITHSLLRAGAVICRQFGFRVIMAMLSAAVLFPGAIPYALGQASPTPPGKLSYQGFLTDGNGTPLGSLTPVNRDIIFRIYDAASGGAIKWAEQQTVTIDKGFFVVLLGEGSQVASEPFNSNLTGSFLGTDASDRYLQITVKGSPELTILPRVQFLSSPYAFFSRQAAGIVGLDGQPVITAGTASVAINKSTAPVSALDVNGTVTATGLTVNGTAAVTGLTVSGATGLTVSGAAGLTVNGTLNAGAIRSTSEITVVNGVIRSGTRNNFYLALQPDKNMALYDGGTPIWSVNDTLTLGGNQTVTGFKTFNNRVEVNDRLQVNAGIYARGGGPGGNNGYAFSGNGGDNDSGMFSSEDGLLQFYANGSERMRILRDRVGIGNGDPQASLHVSGWVDRKLRDSPDGFHNNSGFRGWDGGLDVRIGIKSDEWVESVGFVANSDRRIKDVVGQADTIEALKTVQTLRVTDYRLIDHLRNGPGIRNGFIAQEVKEVLPQAVKASRDGIPSIYSIPLAVEFEKDRQMLRVTFKKAHGLKAGDVVRLMADGVSHDLTISEVPSPTSLAVGPIQKEPKEVFVYGQVVNDFLSVDYNLIFTKGIGAIQELARRVESLERREAHIAELEEKAASVKSLQRELAELKKLVARLAEAQVGLRPASLSSDGLSSGQTSALSR